MKLNSDVILKVSALTKSVKTEAKTLDILHPMDLTVTAGDSLAIVGASGSGKSTLLSIIAGLDLPSSGEVFLKNQPLHQFNEEQRSAVRAKHVGFIFQQFLLINSLTALENIMLPAELAGMDNPEQLARELLAKVDLVDRAEHFPSQLSGGEQQRVAIARAFISKPDILFADEPTGNLDTKTGSHIADLLFELNKQQGTTLILVTHDPKLAARCQRQVIMESGQLSEANVTPVIAETVVTEAVVTQSMATDPSTANPVVAEPSATKQPLSGSL